MHLPFRRQHFNSAAIQELRFSTKEEAPRGKSH
jgi:hypothetical protein